jgi:hypothetical protein
VIELACTKRALRSSIRQILLFIYLFIKDTCIAHYPRVSSKRLTFTLHWLCYLGNTKVTAKYWCARSVITSVIQSGFIFQLLILHSCFTFFCPLSFISWFNSSLWTPNYQAFQDLFNFDGGGNRSGRRKPPVRDPRRKSLLYGATYLVTRAGIEPTPRPDIGYRPVSQTRQTRREPLGHHVPPILINSHGETDPSRSSWAPFVVEVRIEPNTFQPVLVLSIALPSALIFTLSQNCRKTAENVTIA